MKIPSRFVSFPAALAIVVIASGCPQDTVRPDDPVTVVSVSIFFGDEGPTHGEKAIVVGETIRAKARVLDEEYLEVDVPVIWSSSNSSVATVPLSTDTTTTVTGVSAGVVTITATAGGQVDTRTLTVGTAPVGTPDGIVVSSARDGNSEIYLLEASGPRNLTQNAAADITPTKFGDRIFFSSDRSGNFEIYSMKFDGTQLTRLTNNSVRDYWPSVSVNGVVAFAREVAPERDQIFTMNLAGQIQTNISNNGFHEESPAWSPDGTKLAYSSDRDRKFGPRQYMDVYTMNADGTGVLRLTTNDEADSHPAWSPDGRLIAFSTNRPENPKNPADATCYAQASEIWVLNANGTGGLRNLTNTCRGEAWPAWSPSGAEIVFVSDRASTTLYAWDLWKIPSVGGIAVRLTTTGKEATPVWR